MKIIITEEQKKKLFIPRKLSSGDSRYNEHNNSQPIKDGERINQYTPDGLKTGYWEWYYENGRIESKGSYKNGKRDDYWEEYWDNGQLFTKGNYVNSRKDGYWERYFYNGQLLTKGIYVNGEIEGYWEKYYDNGELWYKGNHIEGKRDGYWEIYNKNGVLEYKGNYLNGKEEGYWEWYYSNGKLRSKGNYVNGRRDGYWEWYWGDGDLEIKGSFINGEFIKDKPINESEKKKKLFIPRRISDNDSRYTEWNNSQPIKDGKRINQYTPDGIKTGYWEEYYSTGDLKAKGNYVDGKMDGYWEEYYSNGQLRFKGNFVNGKEDGYREEYYSNGEIRTKGNYVNGKFIQDKSINESIKPEDALTEIDSYKTFEDGRRNVAWIEINLPNDKIRNYINNSINKNDYGYIIVIENPNKPIIVYRDGYKKRAEELYSISKKYGGMLSFNATYEDSKRIGELLEYDPEEITKYLSKNYKSINEGVAYQYNLKTNNPNTDIQSIKYEFTNKDGYEFEVTFYNFGNNNWEREYGTLRYGLKALKSNDVYNIIETVTKITISFIEQFKPNSIKIYHIQTAKETNSKTNSPNKPSKRALLNKRFLSKEIGKMDNYIYKLVGSTSIIDKI